MDVGVPELLIILVLVVLLFGVGRIGKIAGELGSGIRAFREGLQGEDDEKPAPAKQASVEEPAAKVEVIEAEEKPVSVDHRS